jgi:MFS family permease
MTTDLSIGVLNKRHARIAVSALFFLSGLCFASWASRIAYIQQALHLNDAGLGAVLLALPVGSMVSLLPAGLLIGRFGSRRMVIVSASLYAAILPSIGFAYEPWQLIICLFLFGFTGNLTNISMNTQAIAVESMYGRSVMASFHGLWSVGGFTGAAIGGVMGAFKIVPYQHFLIITVIAWVIVTLTVRHIVAQDVNIQEKQPLFSKPDRFLLTLGIIAMCAMICEGTMFDWSGVYFKKVIKTAEGWEGAGYIAFMSTMSTGRFVADWLTTRIGSKRMLQVSGALTALGLLIAVIFPYFITAIIGFLLVGAGISAVVPLIYSAAGRSKVLSPGMALATVSTIGYLGFLCGPPLIGFVAQATSLEVSFSLIAIMGAAIVIMASRLKV